MKKPVEIEALFKELREFIREYSDGMGEPSRLHNGDSISAWAREELMRRLFKLEQATKVPK